MINKLLFSLGVLAVTGLTVYHLQSVTREAQKRQKFLDFKNTHNKTYESISELEYRFEIFKQTLRRIDSVNSDPTKTHTASVNKFSDLTFNEFKSKYLSNLNRSADISYTEELSKKAPKQRDWRKSKGAVGAVKNQADCGSCWAFSTIASLETAVWQKTKRSGSFSEQELVDCAGGKYDNLGCDGGLMDSAYQYIVDNQIATEKAYPYKAKTMKCNRKNKKKRGRQAVGSYKYVQKGVNALTTAAAKQVVSVAIEVQDDFMDYSSGVYSNNDSDCGTELNHGVAVVGYNTAAKKPFFIVRNSWGADWGADGYVKMAISKGTGTCGIASGNNNVVPVL